MNLQNIHCFLLDMDGTVYLSGKLLAGAKETIEKMRSQGRAVFLTNNTSRSKGDYVARLNGLGLNVTRADVFTAADAAVNYLRARKGSNRVYLFGTKSLHKEFADAGIELVTERPDVVVVGFHTELVYEDLVTLCNFIRSGVPYILTHPDKNCPHEGGYLPDVGSLLSLIRTSTDREPEAILGKPSAVMGELIAATLHNRREETLMMGDRLETDIAFAKSCGYASALVLSGATSREQLLKSDIHPDLVLNSIANLFES
ncbi:MAG: HAD-IIA family hydrolase [Clostridia bacterium]|nr:HAD-IIA family hydrolase [Clostridia bacterium]